MDIGVGDAIKALRQELLSARQEGDGAWMRFQPGPVELELQAEVTKDGHGQIGWKILEVGGSLSAVRSHTVRLTMTPQWWDPAAKQYTTDFLVAGDLEHPGARNATGLGHGSGGLTGSEVRLPEVDADPE